MAYDLLVGTGPTIRQKPVIVGAIAFEELPALLSLSKRTESVFLHKICDFMSDARFTQHEIKGALAELLDLLPVDLTLPEQACLHKLIAALSYASQKQLMLFGVAD